MKRSRRWRWIKLGVLLALYLGFWMVGGCADNFILFPSSNPVGANGAARRAIAFENGEVEAWVARSPGAKAARPEAYILEFCGNADRAEWHAADVVDWGLRPVESWVVNYPGYGGSTGPARLSRIGPAALAAYDALAKEADGRPVFVNGTSLGTTAALHVAARRPVAGMILRSPPPLRELVLGHHGWWNLWVLATPVAMGIPADLDSLANARIAKAPAIFILTDMDEVVPIAYQRRVYEAYAGEKQAVSNAGSFHNDPLTAAAADKLANARQWLWTSAAASNGNGLTRPSPRRQP